MERVYIFDMDGTLTESKCALSVSLGKELARVLEKKYVGVISGASFRQFQKQLIAHLPKKINLGNLFFLPMNGSELWDWNQKKWIRVYQELLTQKEIKKIERAFQKTFKEFPLAKKIWGNVLDNREGQITFSGLGSTAPLAEKALWDPAQKKRKKMRLFLKKLLPEFEITIGGTTSLDVTRKGITKAFGVQQALIVYGFEKEETIFIGDALFPGGNDYPVSRIGIQTRSVTSPSETQKILRQIKLK